MGKDWNVNGSLLDDPPSEKEKRAPRGINRAAVMYIMLIAIKAFVYSVGGAGAYKLLSFGFFHFPASVSTYFLYLSVLGLVYIVACILTVRRSSIGWILTIACVLFDLMMMIIVATGDKFRGSVDPLNLIITGLIVASAWFYRTQH